MNDDNLFASADKVAGMVGRTIYDFGGETALVTGSTKGIGLGIAKSFVKAGADVVVNSRSEELVTDRVEELSEKATGEVIGVAGDIGDEDDVKKIVETATERLGTVDILINNAAVWPREESMIEASLKDWDNTFAVNVRSQFYLSKLIAQTMIKNDVAGSIINVTSQAGDQRAGDFGIYGLSNTVINGLTWRMAWDYAQYGIRVNAVSTATTETHQLRIGASEEAGNRPNVSTDEVLQEWGKEIPIGRLGQPEDIADAVLFLASDRAAYVAGTIFRVSGGGNLQ